MQKLHVEHRNTLEAEQKDLSKLKHIWIVIILLKEGLIFKKCQLIYTFKHGNNKMPKDFVV